VDKWRRREIRDVSVAITTELKRISGRPPREGG